jgi:hypothetical protein
MEHIIRLNIFNIEYTDKNKNKKKKNIKHDYKCNLTDRSLNTLKLKVIIETTLN